MCENYEKRLRDMQRDLEAIIYLFYFLFCVLNLNYVKLGQEGS